ncbi:hypothetical protein EJV47_00490 [Hymenobacter gummosus]|uniref:YncE family protein n=1 Tax=Hymenobacter gummosus TaxID=1776032 RepID=A0A431U7N8_9BACT|nr:DUF5074 domain-containing protein [Hymenobacter gummosus]RTQ53253.1 hypothetical protein EJV47_00490 [Hymenobacter gummosus]
MKNVFRPGFPALRTFAGLLAAGLLFSSCDDDKVTTEPAVVVAGQSVLVVNEGQFNQPNSAVSLYNKSTKAVERNLFQKQNQRELGNVAQSMTVIGDRGYIVVNADGRVEVVDMKNFKAVAQITNLSQPRYLTSTGSRAFLTEWRGNYPNYTAGRVSVIDLSTNTVAQQITVGVNPEQILLAGGKLYVANSYGNTLSVINPGNNTVESSVTVPDGPRQLAEDAAGNIWVLSDAFLTRFNPATPTQQTRIGITSDYRNGNLRLNAARDQVYVSIAGAVYRFATTATALPTTPFLRRNLTGLGIDPQDNTVYAGAGSYTADGRVIRYTTTGTVIDSFNVAIAPNSFLFY